MNLCNLLFICMLNVVYIICICNFESRDLANKEYNTIQYLRNLRKIEDLLQNKYTMPPIPLDPTLEDTCPSY